MNNASTEAQSFQPIHEAVTQALASGINRRDMIDFLIAFGVTMEIEAYGYRAAAQHISNMAEGMKSQKGPTNEALQ